MILLLIVNTAFVSSLSIGVNHFFIQLLRGQEVSFKLLFSRLHIFGKCLGQTLMIYIFMLGWGLLTSLPFFFIAYAMGVEGNIVAMLMPFVVISIFVTFYFRYAMASYLLADQPEMGLMESIRISKSLMKGNKGRLFSLYLSLIGWMFLVGLPLALIYRAAPLAGNIASLFIMPVITTYINASTAAFYLSLGVKKFR